MENTKIDVSGKFLTFELSQHTITNMNVIKQFMDINISHKELQKNQWEVKIEK